MRIIRVDTCGGGSSLFTGGMWKEFAWNGDDFDDRFVITGNRDFRISDKAEWCEKAEWYVRSKKIAELLCDGGDFEDAKDICTRGEWDRAHEVHIEYVREMYVRRQRYDILSDIVRIARVLYPGEVFKKYRIFRDIRGGNAGDEWRDVIFRETGVDDPAKAVQRLQAFYFGNVAQIRSAGDYGEGDYVNYVTLDSFLEAEYSGCAESFLRRVMGDILKDGEKIEVYVSDGETRQRKWKRVTDDSTGGDPGERRYVVVETVDRDSSLLPGPDGKDLMTLQQALDVMKHGFEEFCRAYGYDPDEYTEKEAEDDFAGFSFESRSAYSNIRVSIDWKVVEVRR